MSQNSSSMDMDMDMASPSPSSVPKTPEMSSSVLRLWRPLAQRNLRNQWSKLSSLRHQWFSSSSTARGVATSLVNSYLSLRYMDDMDLGVLNDLPNIRKKACSKLLKQLETQRNQLLTSYKAMVSVVLDMTNSSKSMRCFLKTTSGSSILQFSKNSENDNDIGDAGGASVVTFLSISAFELLAEELVEMFKQELILKRVLVVDLLSNSCQEMKQFSELSWADELYDGETDDLKACYLYSEETSEPFLPKLSISKSETSYVNSEKNLNHDVFQVYLTTWLAEVNIHIFRVEEIFVTIREELRTNFS